MSSEKCETASVVDESSGNDAVSLQADDSMDAFVLSSNSSLSSGERTPDNEQRGPFFILYSYMAKLSMQDLSTGSRGPKFYCHLCEDFFHTRLSMITHMKMHGMPFCPVCFAMFPRALDVNYHMGAIHREIAQIGDTSLPFSEELPCVEGCTCVRVDAPPNSPNHGDGVKLEQSGETLDSNNNTISSLLVEKLREHQIAVGLLGDINYDKPDQQLQQGPDAEIQTTINETNGTARGLRNNDKKPTISGTSGKVHKGSKTKSSPKIITSMKGQTDGVQDEHVLKVTSRFGRSISLKIPQF